MIDILLVIIASAIGYLYRDLRDSVKELKKRLPKEEPDLGVNVASYGEVKGYASQDREIGLVDTKTPEQLEFEAKQREQLYGYDNRK